MFWEYEIIFLNDDYIEESRKGVLFADHFSEAGSVLEMFYGKNELIQIDHLRCISDCACLDFEEVNADNDCLFLGAFV